jgi:hypothetical protein
MNTTIEEGLEMILGQFEEFIWPRTISIRRIEGGEILVNNKHEALSWYKAANRLDCRISAYPYLTNLWTTLGSTAFGGYLHLILSMSGDYLD